MPLLFRAEREDLVDLLLRLPNMSNPAARNLLAADLPPRLQAAIVADGAPGTHIGNMVDTANNWEWEADSGQPHPLATIIENALFSVRGSGLARQLQVVLDTVKSRAPAPGNNPAGGQPAQPNAVPGNNPASGQLAQPNNAPGNNPPGLPARLSGAQYQQLQTVLLGAFDQRGALDAMVLFGLNVSLPVIIGDSASLQDTIFKLIGWAQAQGKLTELVQGALNAAPNNQALRAFGAVFGLAPRASGDNAAAPPQPAPAQTQAGGAGLESAVRDLAADNSDARGASSASQATPSHTPSDNTRIVPLTDERLNPQKLSPDDQDVLQKLLLKVNAISNGGRNERTAFLTRARLPEMWIASRTWDSDSLTTATFIVQDAFKLQTQILDGRRGFTALGSLLNQILGESGLGLADGRRVAAIIKRYDLIPGPNAVISPELQVILDRVPTPPQKVEADLEAALRQATLLVDRYLDACWLSDGARATQAVCYIGTQSQEGTGFLIGPDLVLTNFHVVAPEIQSYNRDNPIAPSGVEIRFDYQVETNADGDPVIRKGINHVLAPQWLVDCSPTNDNEFDKVPWLRNFNPDMVGGLDYALLRLADVPGREALRGGTRGWIQPPWGTVKLNDPLFIIQHPLLPNTRATAPLKVVLSYDAVSQIDDTYIKYMTNTEKGSSGSPCFDVDWHLVALHHKGDVNLRNPTGNEGIRIESILAQPRVKEALSS